MLKSLSIQLQVPRLVCWKSAPQPSEENTKIVSDVLGNSDIKELKTLCKQLTALLLVNASEMT